MTNKDIEARLMLQKMEGRERGAKPGDICNRKGCVGVMDSIETALSFRANCPKCGWSHRVRWKSADEF